MFGECTVEKIIHGNMSEKCSGGLSGLGVRIACSITSLRPAVVIQAALVNTHTHTGIHTLTAFEQLYCKPSQLSLITSLYKRKLLLNSKHKSTIITLYVYNFCHGKVINQV